ncbi:MAG: glycosyltransferase family 4 protein [Chloroflexota bacterium]
MLSSASGYRRAGVSRYIEALLNELPAFLAGDDRLIAYGPAAVSKPPAPGQRLEWRRSRLNTESPPLRILWEQTAGAAAGLADRLDVLHSPVNVVPLLSTVPAVLTVHDLAFERYPEHYPAAKQRYLSLMTRLSALRAARIIAVSEATRNDLVECYRVSPDKVAVVPNGVDDRFRPVEPGRADAFRASQDLPEHFILFVGTLQPRKNLETLLVAMSLLPRGVDWPLVVVGGGGWKYDTIFRTVKRYGIGDRVRFAGYVPVEDLPEWYAASSIVVIPSHYEGFGLPALEAMASGVPVIAANASSLPEVVGDDGVLFDPADAAELAAAIVTLVENADLRRQLVQRGRERATGYTWWCTAAETYEIYREVAGD